MQIILNISENNIYDVKKMCYDVILIKGLFFEREWW